MVIYKIKLFFALLLFSRLCYSQDFNCNQVKNWDFQNGGYPCGIVHLPVFSPYYQEYSFNGVISSWVIGKNSPDWVDVNQQKTIDFFNAENILINATTFPSNRFIYMGAGEAFRQSLFHPLVSGKTYQLRIKTASFGESNLNLCVNAHFTRWGENWFANSNNNNKLVIGSFCSFGNWNFANWSERVMNFTVDEEDDNLLTNITIRCATEGNGNAYTRLVDDVELYEYCPPELLFENQRFSYKSPVPYEGYRVIAGYDVGNTVLGNGNVIIGSEANITFKGVFDVVLEPGFETETGAEFFAYTAPCGATEFPLPSPQTINHCLNPNDATTLSIGGLYNPLYHYEWTPHDFLSSPYNMMTNVVIPDHYFTTDGTIVYYLHVTDGQGNDVINPVPYVINYTTGIEILYTPNSFAPAGNNPYFIAVTNGADHYDFTVFQGWGTDIVFQNSQDINLASPQTLYLWDGHMENGNIPEGDQFSYNLIITNKCGQQDQIIGGGLFLYRSANIRSQFYLNSIGQSIPIEAFESFPAGFYIFVTEYEDGSVESKKIIKNENN